MSSNPLLTEDIVEELAVAFLKFDGDALRISEETGIEVTRDFLAHPKIAARVARLAGEMREKSNSIYTLEHHRDNLARIRDAAMRGEDYKAAIAAEMAIGKVSGFYEPRLPGEGDAAKPVDTLSNEELKSKLMKKLSSPKTIEGEILDG